MKGNAMRLRLVMTGDSEKNVAAAVALRDRFAKSDGCLGGSVLYEHDVVRTDAREYVEGREHERILAYNPENMRARVSAIKASGLLRVGDMVIRNVEDGHPADGKSYQAVHTKYARDLSQVVPESPRCGYGLIKRDIWRQAVVPGRISRPAREFDAAVSAAAVFDTHVLAELYVPVPSSDAMVAGTIRPQQQEAWMLDSVSRAKRVASLGPPLTWTFALISVGYQGGGGGGAMAGMPLHDLDVARVARVASLCNDAGLWLHIGAANVGGVTAEAAERETRRWVKALAKW